MTSWITEADIKDTVIPEVNRIWRQANIRISLEDIEEARMLDNPDEGIGRINALFLNGQQIINR